MSEQTREDGGPAFPGKKLTRRWSDAEGATAYETIPSAGMSLRDYFAAKAMPTCVERSFSHDLGTVEERVERAAAFAYKLADAMLKARK